MNGFIFVILMSISVFELVMNKMFDQEEITSDPTSNYYGKESMTVNISTVVGKTVHLNCSLVRDSSFGSFNYFRTNKHYDHFKEHSMVDSKTQEKTSSTTDRNGGVDLPSKNSKSTLTFNPTWLKADAIYTQYGFLNGYKTENIIVTRKGIIPDSYRNRMRLIGQGDKIQMLKISDVEIRDEGKYICRELNSKIDRSFYINVLSPIRELSIKFHSNSKFFREIYTGNRDAYENVELNSKPAPENSLAYGSNTVSIKENDELVITCIVNSSKPAANLSIWILKRKNGKNQFHDDENLKSNNNEVDSPNDDYFDVNDSKQLDIIDSYVVNNKDLTLKTVSTSKLIISRNDNHRLISCVAENTNLNEKWESKRVLNVLYGPKCSKYQKSVFNTGINQTIDLECHMADANPPYLDFTWNFFNSQAVKERMRSNGFISRISWTPRSEKDFGEITCTASNGLDVGECKMRLELGGPPNPPYDCYHKENNKTIIIECKPGFEQGDPEVYFYLLKRKSNGMLVEYARKRDSCSFLISNLILEEYLNDFFIYSSNKYGSNRDKATKIMIENKEFLLKSTNKLEEMNLQNNKQITYVITVIISIMLVFCFVCCLLMRCKKDSGSQSSNGFKSYANGYLEYGRNTVNRNSVHFQEPYKYSAHNSQYSSKTSIHLDGKNKIPNSNNVMDEKDDYFNASDTSSSDNYEKDLNGVYDNSSFKKSYSKLNEKSVRSPSLLNSTIQDLDMSPRSKRKSLEKTKESYGCSRSLIDETTETDSDNYVEFNKCIVKSEKIFETINDDYDFNSKYYNQNSNLTTNLPKNGSWILPKVNVWYGNGMDNTDCDNYSGISVDKPMSMITQHTSPAIMASNSTKNSEHKSFKNQPQTKPPNLNDKINEYIDDQGDTGDTSDTNTNNTKDDHTKSLSLFKWQKNKLISSETISLDVDDEKIEGILV